MKNISFNKSQFYNMQSRKKLNALLFLMPRNTYKMNIKFTARIMEQD